MFDSTPPNLPMPPADKAPAPQASAQPKGMINQTGIKEPEDIFADIKETEIEASMTPSGNMPTRFPSGNGFPWKVVISVGIPVIVLALGIGGWYVYSSYRSATKTVQPPSPTAAQQTTVPVTAEPDNTQPLPNPVPKPDEEKFAAQQAAITLMQNQAAQADMMGEYATSETPSLENGTAGMMGGLYAVTSTEGAAITGQETNPPVPPPNIPSPVAAIPATEEMQPSLDTDNDGLTNSEEVLLGTDPSKTDSDGDGFADLSEVMSGYDPAVAKHKLIDAKSLKVELVGNINLLIPTAWERQAGPGGTVQIMTGTPAVMTISLQPYATSQSLLDWAVMQNEGSAAPDYVTDRTVSGADVVYSKDKMSAWVLVGNTVYVFRYGTNGATSLDFMEIFQDIIIRQLRVAQS